MRAGGNCIRSGDGGLKDRKGNEQGIQLVGLSWAKKMNVLRTKFYGVRLFYNLFISLVDSWLLECYMGYMATF